VGAATTPLLDAWFGWDLPWWIIAGAAWAIVAVLGVRRIDVNGRILAVLMVAEIAIIVIFSAADLLHPAGGRITVDTLAPANLAGPGLGALLVLAVLGFVGFENSVVFSEESRNRDRTVATATYTSIVVIAALYGLSSWAMTVATGPDQITARATEHGPDLLFVLATERLGSTVADIGHALFATSLIAAMISFHNTTARYTFALGREGVWPRLFGRTNPAGAPKAGSLTQSGIGLAVIVLYAITGWDPVTRLFFWAGTSGGLGVLLLIATTAIAIPTYFARHPTDEPAWRRLIAPTVAAVLMLGVAALAVANFATVLGPAPALLPTAVPAAYLLVAILGAAYALWLRATRSPVYPRIGLGARSDLPAPAVAAGPAPAERVGR
jgi:amino acid transporter